MESTKRTKHSTRLGILILGALIATAAFVLILQTVDQADTPSGSATYSRGVLHVDIPYHADHAGSGRLTMEVLDPEDKVLGKAERHVDASEGQGQWQSEIKLQKPMPLDDLVWHRVRYRFEYDDGKFAAIDGTESISQIIRTPVVRVIGQQSYYAGGPAAVRVIVMDSQAKVIPGGGSVQIDLTGDGRTPRLLYTGSVNRRGTTEAQFRLPAGLTGSFHLHYFVDTTLGSTELTQDVQIADKVSILLTTEKPIYQPSQTIHVRALALDRADHHAAGHHKLTFEVEDSKGNKVFKKATETDDFGVASAEFELADEVNLGTYHVRALMGDPESPSSSAEMAVNVQRYVLPKFKVAVDFNAEGHEPKHGYRPGDHVTGTVRANYFFGKPVDEAAIVLKASAMDVAVTEVATEQGKTTADGSYRFDLTLPTYFAGRPLSHGAAQILIEATVKDSAGHSETRGDPITVSESPVLITAVPEGGTLAPDLDNQVFILTAYPDGTPARTSLKVRAKGNPEQSVETDDGGVAVVHIRPKSGAESLKIEAVDHDGNRASSEVQLETRDGSDQILLRADRAVYRAGEPIHLNVFSTKTGGAAYVDVVKDGQTVLTRDLDFNNGRADLTLSATAEMAGTVDINAYLFGQDSRPVADHRLIFVQPADELKIEAEADAQEYKPGAEAQIKFHVTNARGTGVHAALGLQIVDEAVFALAEKQPGFAKVFFYLEQEVMKPRYEIHSIGMPDIVEPPPTPQAEERDRAAQALFSATEIVNANKYEGQFGGDVPTEKQGEYSRRYGTQFEAQVRRLIARMDRAYAQNSEGGDLTKIFDDIKSAAGADAKDAWCSDLRVQHVAWDPNGPNFVVQSAGPDKAFDNMDDIAAFIVRTGAITRPPSDRQTKVDIEHDRGPFNGLAQIEGTVTDVTGAVVPGAVINAFERGTGIAKSRLAKANASGQFSLSGLPPGDYQVQISSQGFKHFMQEFTLKARDRAVVSAVLEVGSVTQSVQVTGQSPIVLSDVRNFNQPIPAPMAMAAEDRMEFRDRRAMATGVPGGMMGGVGGVMLKSAGEGSDRGVAAAEPEPTARVRSYFPEALYINPEIITDKDGRASIVVPIADSITTWRMAMIASTQQGALGTASSSLKVFQDFFVDLDLPVTLTQGDRVSIPVGIYNYSGARGQVSVKLQREDWYSLADDDGEKSVDVESGRVGASQFTIQARRIGKFKLTLNARMGGQAKRADIVVREIEVIPNGREETQVFNGRLENVVQHEVKFPADAIPEASKIFVRLYPGPLSQVIEGMDSLLRMPYGCFEQTSSSTYPNVLALDYMKRTKKLTPEVHAKAEGFIATGYQRLLTFEVPGGGFSWFGQVPANKILTAYGLMEFYDMSKVYDVDPKLIQRTQQWLADQQQGDGSWKPDTYFINEGATNRYNSDVLRITAYIAWSLENTGYQGPAVGRAKEFAEKHLDGKVDAYTLAVVANFAVDNGGNDREFTRQAMQLLLDARTEKDEQAWWNSEQTGVYGEGLSASVETTGLAVQALLKWGQASGTVRKALNYITSKKDASGTWGTTQATIMALRALLLATEKGSADTQGVVDVLLNGKSVETLTLTSDNNDLLHQFVFKGAQIGSATDSSSGPRGSEVELRFQGKGGLAYQVVGSYFLPWDQKPAHEALSIDVAYDRTRLAQDDIATATATVKNNLNKKANMVMVDLGIPPGFDLLSEDLQDYQDKSAGMKTGRLEKFSLTATQAILYFDSFAPNATTTIKFRLRAKYPIRARTFKSQVYEYYNPQVSSVARPVQLEVVKK